MAIKKPTPEPARLMRVGFGLDYNSTLLLTYTEASQLMLLLEKAQVFTESYDEKTTSIRKGTKDNQFIFKPMDMEVYDNVLVAQTLGVTFKEFNEQIQKEKDNGVE